MSFSHNSNLEKQVSRKDVTITNLNSKIQSLERENLNFKFLAREDSNHSLNKLEHHIQHPSTSNEGSSSSSFNSSNNFNSNHGRSFTRSHIFDTNTSGTNLNTTNLNIGSISTDSSSDALYFNARQKLSEKLKHVSQTPASKSNSLVVINASLTNPVTKRKTQLRHSILPTLLQPRHIIISAHPSNLLPLTDHGLRIPYNFKVMYHVIYKS